MSEILIYIKARKQLRGYMRRTQRWACIVAHRRFGKTYGVLQDLVCRALQYEREGPPTRYAYIAPTRDQAKDIAWAYIKEFTHEIPGMVVNESELRVTFPNGAQIRLYSGDNYERMRGVYFDGVIIDEMGDIPPKAWTQVIRPCLSDYQGWATFIGTPKGKNAFYRFHRMAEERDEWFSLVLKASESGVIPDDELEDLKRTTPEDDYNQEYECDFNIGRPGAIYAADLEVARRSGRVLPFPVDRANPVYTTWDLGSPANTVVLYWQRVGFTYRLIDCDHHITNPDGTPMKTGERVAFMMSKGYPYAGHLLPHDAKNVQYDAMSMVTKLREAGLANVKAIPKGAHGAEEKRTQTMADLFPSIWFNEENLNDKGGFLEALDNYHRAESKKDGWISNKIVHDWSSHFADAFGYFGEAMKHHMIQAGTDAAMPQVQLRRPTIPRNSPSRR